jgi:MFS transporter, ACS family, glucarate transporter
MHATTTRYFPIRYLMVAGTFLISVLLYIDRACISAAKESIALDLALNDKQIGWVLSIFTLGYALMQTPSGILADRYGPRRVLSSIMIIWSLLTALTGAAWNFFSMLLVRLLFGAGEAGAFPGMARAVYSWIPLRERGLVQGINFSGSRLGAAFALPLVALMIQALEWRLTFLLLGGFGLLFGCVWYLWFRDSPFAHGQVSEPEKAFLQTHLQSPGTDTEQPAPLSAAQLLGSRNMWLAMGQYFSSNFTFFFCLTWLFPYVKEQYSLEMVEAGMYASLPLLAGAAGNWVSGWWVDRLYRQGKWAQSRQWPAMIGFALAAIGMIASLHMHSVGGAITFLSLAIFGADMTLSPSWSFCIDIGKSHAGTVSGTMNMAGNIGSFVTALAFPYLRDWTGSIEPFFYLGAALNLLAIFIWLRMRPEEGVTN